jgi:AraC family transcriptional regulator
MRETDEFSALHQRGGGVPTTLAAGRAPGESGVRVLSQRFEGGLYAAGTPKDHHICFQTSSLHIERRVGGSSICHVAPEGGLAICPAGADFTAEANASGSMLLVAIDPSHLTLAVAESAAKQAQLNEQLSGYNERLFDCASTMAIESGAGYPRGALFWNEVAYRFIHCLVAHHMSLPENKRTNSMLDKVTFDKLRAYIYEHLEEQIEVAELAAIADLSPFHFSRVFARSFGVTPYRYVVRLRLQRAVELIRDKRYSLPEIAARTGFSDQSHLTRWVRRVHGITLTELCAYQPSRADCP